MDLADGLSLVCDTASHYISGHASVCIIHCTPRPVTCIVLAAAVMLLNKERCSAQKTMRTAGTARRPLSICVERVPCCAVTCALHLRCIERRFVTHFRRERLT